MTTTTTTTTTDDDGSDLKTSSPSLTSPNSPPHPRSDDALFYDAPRFVTHIDDAAIASLTEFYARTFPPSGTPDAACLDLCSSWISHYPKGYKAARVVGLGMNAEELRKNAQLTESVVQDLNKDPKLPFEVNEFFFFFFSFFVFVFVSFFDLRFLKKKKKNSSSFPATGRLLRRHHQLRQRRLPHQALRGLHGDGPGDEARGVGDLRLLQQDVSDQGRLSVDLDRRRRPRAHRREFF